MATMYEKMMERLVDRVADQAVEIAKLKQEAENLKKEMAYYGDLHQKVRDDLDQVRDERDTFLADLRLRQVEARQAEHERNRYKVQLEEALSILEPLSLLDDVIQSLVFKDQAVDLLLRWADEKQSRNDPPYYFPVGKEPAARAS